ncbi:hypothetical protein CFC21_004522 [Triticum aestivum]|uniref:Uncharacterized protein n=1 Tax=Triticum aestivum TaxID=4565 RepID=A0A3B5Y7F6_WHEAT|nr:hypothetical protein CFC21_004522 [Triticum aestivum]
MSSDAGTAGTSNSVAPAAAQSGGGNNSSQHVVISEARQPFRAVNEDLFTPLSVSIGPYHRASCSDRWKQEKKRVAEETVKYLQDSRGQEAAHQLEEKVGQLVEDVRGCYGGLPDMKSEELVSMLLHDGCYVLKFFVQYPGHPDVSPPRGEDNTVMRDIMYLLENQLPMIVLKRIHQCLVPERSVVNDVEDRVLGLLSAQLYIRGVKKRRQAVPSHLLELVHTYFQPRLDHSSISVDSAEQSESHQQRSATRNNVQNDAEVTGNTRRCMGRWRRATEYSRYGDVQLKRQEFAAGVVESILDVSLEGRTLLIPRLRIVSSTWTILRNLMALEEQTGGDGSPVTAYCLFMSQLASKVEDIELLKRKEIVDHYWGNDEEVAQGFADLCKKVVLDVDDVDSNYLGHIWHRLHERCESLGHNCLGSFRQRHCGDSMRILAFVTAGLLFAFQLIQVILTGFSLRQQGK